MLLMFRGCWRVCVCAAVFTYFIRRMDRKDIIMMRGENEGQERDMDIWTGAEEVRNVMWIRLKIEWRGV